MTLTVRHIGDDELTRFIQVLAYGFSDTPRTDAIPAVRKYLELDRTVCAYDGDLMVGASSAFSFRMTVPGGEVPISAVTMIAVIPTHRRKGALTKMMAGLIRDAQERSEPLAALWASEESIYQRFGYGLASFQNSLSLERDRARLLVDDPPQGSLRYVEPDAAVAICTPIYERVRAETPGMMTRTVDWWSHHTLRDPEHRRGSAAPLAIVVWNDGDDDVGYVVYRVEEKWSDEGTPVGRVTINELVGATPRAEKELWRFIFGIDLMKEIRAWFMPQDPPIAHMLLEPRRARLTNTESFWARVLDVPAALTARSYRQDGILHLGVTDHLVGDNTGTWTLEVEDGRAHVERSQREPDVQVDIATLSALYMGGFTFDVLQRAGRVRENEHGGVGRADDLFRWPRAPWCVENF